MENYGHDDTAVYSGGKLTLIRGGETTYAATKVWRDAYEQNPGEGGAPDRPKAAFTLYRYLWGTAPSSAVKYEDGVTVQLVWVPEESSGEGSSPEPGGEGEETPAPAVGHWEIRVINTADKEEEDPDPAQLPQYDSQSGREWIYVVKETLSGANAGSYEQVFGTTKWENGEWVDTEDDLKEEWGLDTRTPTNTYLYNEDTLTNRQTGTVSVGATKEWRAATFQSSLSGVVVELTLQVRDAGDKDGWKDYTDAEGEPMRRYLYSFSAVQLTETLADPPAMEQYRGGDKTQELEYRWLETAVYTGIDKKEVDVEEAVASSAPIEVIYENSTETSSCTSDDPVGTFRTVGNRTWTIEYKENDRIVNRVQDTVNYEVVKEWHQPSNPEKITLQIFRAVTGEAFDYTNPYLEFTMDRTDGQKVDITTKPLPSDEIKVKWGIDGYGSEGEYTSWPAVVTGLPAYDEDGRTYEYILLEKTESGNVPTYRNEETETADYRTVVVNGQGSGGFNLLIRKTWLDNSDTAHREPVTFTLYNRHTEEPVKYVGGESYTITLGEDNIWSSVFWVGTNGLAEDSMKTDEDDGEFGADDVYLVETSVGLDEVGHKAHEVKHYLDGPDETLTYDALYKDGHGTDGKIFDVTTENHRYQVTYKAEYETGGEENEGQFPGGIGAAFTITNRRLGSIDLTVNKTWIDGRARDGGETAVQDPNLSQEIGAALEKIYKETSTDGKGGTRLALVFRLVFDESMDAGSKKDWAITYSGPDAWTDTVTVGGEEVDIYSGYDENGDYDLNKQASSEQVIIGVNKYGEAVISNTAHFFNLPKYDETGSVVSYSVEELWLDVTEASTGKQPKVVTDKEMEEKYSNLYALWSDYTDPEFRWTYEENVGGAQHTKDVQTLDVTNRRSTPKTVTWTKDWEDAYTNESGLRPDLYLDIYRVIHVPVTTTSGEGEEGSSETTYQRRIEYVGSSGEWNMSKDDTWTLSMKLAAFDQYGFAIYYYAVERTNQPASLYDYQAGQYSLDGQPLGTRDEPLAGVEVLSDQTEQAAGDVAYDLLVLGKQNPEDTEEPGNIQWANGHSVQGTIGAFGQGGSLNYAKYALLEGGTFTNTLAEEYSINGMKYWTNLNGWPEEHLPDVKFLVYRYTQEDANSWGGGRIPDAEIQDVETGNFIDNSDECEYYAAQLTIGSDQWESLKSGNGYRYLIQYNGENTLNTEDGELVCIGENGADHLERYDENGELYTYEIREVVQWEDDQITTDGSDVFTVNQAANGFYFTNKYDPDTGSIRVKKFLYLPTDSEGEYVFPAVTFKLTRQVTYNGETYEPDSSFGVKEVTISSVVVEEAWKNAEKTSGYVTLYETFQDLPLYAPNGREYRYTVIEDRDELQGYTTWAEKGNKNSPEEVIGQGEAWTPEDSAAYPNAGITDGVKISGLCPAREANPDSRVDKCVPAATFKNQPDNPPETYEGNFTATKVWDDNGDAYGFRPEAGEFTAILKHVEKDEATKEVTWSALVRTAASQTGQGNGMTEYLSADEDYTLEVTDSGNDTYAITITPKGENAFEKYAPNGMPWVYSFREPVTGNHRLLIDPDDANADENKIYAPPVKSDGRWETTISSSSPDTSFGSLTNTTHMEYQFNKAWVGEDGKPITENYLGEDFQLTVTFQLQVSEDERETWTDAGVYFAKKKIDTDAIRVENAQQGTGESWDTADITGTVDAPVWSNGGTFTKLPTVLKDGAYILLQYRVIETSVSWGDGEGQSQTIDLPEDKEEAAASTFAYDVDKEGLVTGAAFTRQDSSAVSTSTNRLETTSVSVTKVWDDANNQYGTRPGADGPWTWASWFVLQRATGTDDSEDENAVWENVAVFDMLFGNNAESGSDTDPAASGNWEATITGLPTMDYTGETARPYTYRVRELQPRDGGYTEDGLDSLEDAIVGPGGTYNPDGVHYTATYSSDGNAWTVANSMDTPTGEIPKNIVVEKVWAGADENGSVGAVTFRLEYSYTGADGETVWETADFLSGGQWEQTANAANGWAVQWEELPDTDGDGREVTGYRVVEEPGSGWVQIGKPEVTHDESTGTTTYAYRFTNSVAVSHAVEKVWNPDTAPAGASVTLALYRTTEAGAVGSLDGKPVPADELDPTGNKRTVTLDGTVDGTETTAWKATFANLPKYNADGELYHYYALELDGTTPIGQNGKITLNAVDYEVSYDWTTSDTKTAVTNTTAIGLTGTKTWVDNGDAYETRPEELTLRLERKVGTGDWEDVSVLYAPTWDKTTGAAQNQWTYTFTGLPSCDENRDPLHLPGAGDCPGRVRADQPEGRR